MKIKDTLLSFLSFGESLTVKDHDNEDYKLATKFSYGPSVVKSSLACKNTKDLILSSLVNTLPFAVLSVLVFALINFLNGEVLTYTKFFGAGIICYFAFVLVELIINSFRHAKKHKILSSTLIIAAVTFVLTSGTAIREIYNIIAKEYLPSSIFNISALPIIFALISFAVISGGEVKLIPKTIVAGVISLLFVASNVKGLAYIPYIVYVKLALLLALIVLMVLSIIKENKGLKINFKKPLIIFGITAVLTIALALVLAFVFGDIHQVKFILNTAFAGVFGGDVTSVALLENTVGGGTITNNNILYGVIGAISYIMPGSFLVNALTLAGFDMGAKGENGTVIGILYAAIGFIVTVGLVLSVISLYIEFIKAGANTKTMVTVKRYVTAAIMGAAFVTIISLVSSFVNLMSITFSGVFGILFAVSLILINFILIRSYKINCNLVAVATGIFTLLVMLFSDGIVLY